MAGAGLLVQTLDALEDGILSPVEQSDRRREPRAEDRGRRRAGALVAPGARRRPAGPRLHAGAGRVDDAARRLPARVWHRSSPSRTSTDLAPGQLLVGKKEVLVGTGGHAVRLTEVTPQGKRAMAAADWARGARLDADAVLGGAA